MLTPVDYEIAPQSDEDFASAMGISLGDAAFMLPEQCTGDEIDLLASADPWCSLHQPTDEERCR